VEAGKLGKPMKPFSQCPSLVALSLPERSRDVFAAAAAAAVETDDEKGWIRPVPSSFGAPLLADKPDEAPIAAEATFALPAALGLQVLPFP